MAKMEWDRLLSPERERQSTTPEIPFRNAFDKDYERVISSSSVRRLQDKAQVFPLQENDFTRTRLTHSLEVSSIGRSLGKRVGFHLKESGAMKNTQDEELASLLAVAGLVHDLGNPPFGHYGEDIIKDWFEINLKSFGAAEWVKDYLYFDGNAQTIRILSRLQFLQDRHGMNFSYGTLGTLIKYPWESTTEKAKESGKTGYFISEKDLADKIFAATGMRDESGTVRRHPATYLLEAADDIAYLFADLEDTAKKGYLPWDGPEGAKEKILSFTDEIKVFSELRKRLANTAKSNTDNKIPFEERILNEVMTFRVFCQGICIEQVCDEFITNYDSIMDGTYNNTLSNGKCSNALLDGVSTEKMISAIREICIEYAYRNNEVLSLELIAKSVLTSLLDKFISAVSDEKNYSKPKHENGKLYRLISTNFKYVQHLDKKSKFNEKKVLSEHERVQLVIDYISCMTDSYALNLHKTLLGMKLP